MKRILCAVAVTTICGTWPGATSAGGTPAQKCEAAQLKAVGKDAACHASQLVKGLFGGTVDLTKCSMPFTAAFMNAEAKGGCLTPLTATAIDSRINDEISSIISGLTLRFVDNGDGTITDNETGLQWEQKVDGNGCTHCVGDQYTWSNAETDAAPDGTAFTVFLAQLNACVSASGVTSAGGFAGHCDWRLPTVAELQTLGACAPGCGTSLCDSSLLNLFPTFPIVPYWSSTTVAQATLTAWGVAFPLCGPPTAVEAKSKVVGLLVRAVRTAF